MSSSSPSPALAPIELCAPSRQQILAPYKFETLVDDPRLTALTDFAAALCEAPTALVTLVDDEHQRFLAGTGMADRQTPAEGGFCTAAMVGEALMIVPDATRDPRFSDNPLVTGPSHLRFYAGVPLRGADGQPLGSLCIIDGEPRDGLTPLQERGLCTLAQAVTTLFESNRALIEEQGESSVARDQRDDQEQRFKVLADTMPQMVWSTPPDGLPDYFNARWYEFTGAPVRSTEGANWTHVFHPDVQDRASAVWNEAVDTGQPYEIEYRLRDRHGTYRWVLGRALPMADDAGRITRWFGTCTDIHDHKMALQERELISHELSHRIKNIFSVISGLISLSSRTHPELKPVADQLRERVMALGTAHDFVRPHSEASRPTREQSSLHGLIDELLAPYQSSSGERITISGTDPGIDDRSATPLALLFHELATNSAKYGALANPGGQITLSCQQQSGATVMHWRERGAAMPSDPANRPTGFGSRLIAMSVEQQLGGQIERIWHHDGLEAVVTVPTNAMRRD